jgi:hypothetical protein
VEESLALIAPAGEIAGSAALDLAFVVGAVCAELVTSPGGKRDRVNHRFE